eukprot:TRINITY_DN23337_c0_g1_i2.p1 TRINITY_DN23337_c0_g1~~TRINITY_DN23337_c0_g1_i2.p1  ORF type:complete len:859 (-),score=77.88 TRINITY_DN23337_c0_g1_i2:21-2597(-)
MAAQSAAMSPRVADPAKTTNIERDVACDDSRPRSHILTAVVAMRLAGRMPDGASCLVRCGEYGMKCPVPSQVLKLLVSPEASSLSFALLDEPSGSVVTTVQVPLSVLEPWHGCLLEQRLPLHGCDFATNNIDRLYDTSSVPTGDYVHVVIQYFNVEDVLSHSHDVTARVERAFRRHSNSVLCRSSEGTLAVHDDATAIGSSGSSVRSRGDVTARPALRAEFASPNMNGQESASLERTAQLEADARALRWRSPPAARTNRSHSHTPNSRSPVLRPSNVSVPDLPTSPERSVKVTCRGTAVPSLRSRSQRDFPLNGGARVPDLHRASRHSFASTVSTDTTCGEHGGRNPGWRPYEAPDTVTYPTKMGGSGGFRDNSLWDLQVECSRLEAQDALLREELRDGLIQQAEGFEREVVELRRWQRQIVAENEELRARLHESDVLLRDQQETCISLQRSVHEKSASLLRIEHGSSDCALHGDKADVARFGQLRISSQEQVEAREAISELTSALQHSDERRRLLHIELENGGAEVAAAAHTFDVEQSIGNTVARLFELHQHDTSVSVEALAEERLRFVGAQEELESCQEEHTKLLLSYAEQSGLLSRSTHEQTVLEHRISLQNAELADRKSLQEECWALREHACRVDSARREMWEDVVVMGTRLHDELESLKTHSSMSKAGLACGTSLRSESEECRFSSGKHDAVDADIKKQLEHAQRLCASHAAVRERQRSEIASFTCRLDDESRSYDEDRHRLQELLGSRNAVIYMLLAKLRARGSQGYEACPGDIVDATLADRLQTIPTPVPFYRLRQGQYLFGTLLCRAVLERGDLRFYVCDAGPFTYSVFLEHYGASETEAMCIALRDDGA